MNLRVVVTKDGKLEGRDYQSYEIFDLPDLDRLSLNPSYFQKAMKLHLQNSEIANLILKTRHYRIRRNTRVGMLIPLVHWKKSIGILKGKQ